MLTTVNVVSIFCCSYQFLILGNVGKFDTTKTINGEKYQFLILGNVEMTGGIKMRSSRKYQFLILGNVGKLKKSRV